MDPILWHTKNIISDENVKLHEYLWNWWAYLVQKPQKKPRTILVLKSALQQCGKNIITDFIGDKVLGEHLHYATSDLEKILGHFNSAIQARKLIVMNETGMSSGDWHRFNGHLKSLITEGMVTIERKGLEFKRLKDFAGYMVTSNQDAPIKIDIGDFRVVCFNVSSRCRDINIESKQVRTGGGKREWVYILDRPKIVAKLRESGLGNMEEFFDIPDPRGIFQPDLPENETADIPIFNVPETVLKGPTISQKIIPLQPEKNTPSHKDTYAPVASTSGISGTSKTFKPPEPVIDEFETSKLPESVKPISEVVNTLPKETSTDSPKPINQVSSAILLSRAQREERLRKRAVELGEDPNVFVTITEKDRLDSIAF
ncbi:hypothetical protein RhiirC2_795509 [Rhizophagus irregularis]|uniref:NrS-1 polymerase-like helicase domain-containing protein n=1 Tax=Rhizophagus irregularis TaxID=588596 RepID=A0A2N1MBE7_9GLOM|nr:hypothetical protein RhiirC2_795509 [Rhizophagus irregularis]